MDRIKNIENVDTIGKHYINGKSASKNEKMDEQRLSQSKNKDWVAKKTKIASPKKVRLLQIFEEDCVKKRTKKDSDILVRWTKIVGPAGPLVL